MRWAWWWCRATDDRDHGDHYAQPPFHVAEGTIGKPLAGREVKLGPDGEVLVRGASISGATCRRRSASTRGEWLATGDLAVAQSTGELRFLAAKAKSL